MTLGIFVRSNSALKICDKKIKQPNAIIAVDTDIYLFFPIANIQKINDCKKTGRFKYQIQLYVLQIQEENFFKEIKI
jgi:hypothetical protein